MEGMAKYRLYIDESGTPNYASQPKSAQGYSSRYLGLTGIIVEEKENDATLLPKINELRKLISGDIDDLPVLHAEEIRKSTGKFSRFQDPDFKQQFNEKFEDLLDTLNYTLITIVVDKAEQKEKYGNSSMNPYHYCLTLMLERYVLFLSGRGATGDVMAECRAKKEDDLLSKEFEKFYNYGTYYISAAKVSSRLTSKHLKFKSKDKGIAGLQLADLISLPSRLDVLDTYARIPTGLSKNYSLTIIKKLQPKYLRSAVGQVKGVGKKLV